MFVLLDDAGYLPQIVRPESVIDRQMRGRQPEFGIKTAFCNVNMRRLVAFFGIAIELVAVNSQHGWHGGANLLKSIVISHYSEHLSSAYSINPILSAAILE